MTFLFAEAYRVKMPRLRLRQKLGDEGVRHDIFLIELTEHPMSYFLSRSNGMSCFPQPRCIGSQLSVWMASLFQTGVELQVRGNEITSFNRIIDQLSAENLIKCIFSHNFTWLQFVWSRENDVAFPQRKNNGETLSLGLTNDVESLHVLQSS